jgi:hypothetical protein
VAQPHNSHKEKTKMNEAEKIKKLKEQEAYYTPTKESHNALSGCISAWFVFVSAVALLLALGWFWLAYSAPQPAPIMPTPEKVIVPVTVYIYPTVTPTTPAQAAPLSLINSAAGQLQTVTFVTAQVEIGYRFVDLNGGIEEKVFCYGVNVCSWNAPAVPVGNDFEIVWKSYPGTSLMFAPRHTTTVPADALLIQLEN